MHKTCVDNRIQIVEFLWHFDDGFPSFDVNRPFLFMYPGGSTGVPGKSRKYQLSARRGVEKMVKPDRIKYHLGQVLSEVETSVGATVRETMKTRA